MPDPIKLYLKDIKNIPLLTPEEEVELSRKALRGDEEARTRMIRSNLRLVINIAKKYAKYGVPLMDLIEEGNLGLIKAVSKYNPEKGYRFSTYAAWWIKQYVTRAIANQAKTIRVPVYMTELMQRCKKTTERLTQRLGRKPKVKEIAKEMGVDPEKVREIRRVVRRPASLDAPVGEDGTSEFIDIVEDQSIASPGEELAVFLQRERLDQLLELMDVREKRILELRFGLEDGEGKTLGETAKHFGITRERVRQIELQALKKLRKIVEEEEDVLFKKERGV
ncbi:MAG: sigma-70 family RNA polymerase sigma factor [Candidatus Omnitrophica bacterium]|nr:sigma-70 family RNA polymerase sigma factor [Candidatus Omnitrophota bacterium]